MHVSHPDVLVLNNLLHILHVAMILRINFCYAVGIEHCNVLLT